jgi:hypothetical protein
MAAADAFEVASDEIERSTSLSRLEARGTLRLALKEAGLDPASVTPSQMRVVVDKVLPGSLTARGIEKPTDVCRAVGEKLARLAESPLGDRPEAVFARLGGPR